MHIAFSYGGIASARKPASTSRSISCIWRGESSSISQLHGDRDYNSFASNLQLSGGSIRLGGTSFQLSKNLAQSRNQLVARNMALLELNPELEGFARRLKLKDERPRALWSSFLLPALPPRFVASQSALQNALKHLDHFLLRRLPRNLQQKRF